jgi:DNA-binding transcriptional LysR family regulator
MTLEQLRVFVAVAERLNMTRAAEGLHITQSAASAAIGALERRYSTSLFDRVGRGLVLSDAGSAFLPQARDILQRSEAAAETLADLAGLTRGALTLAASQTIASYWLPSRMARFAQAHPGVTLQLLLGNTAQVAQSVLEGSANLGFLEGEVDLPLLEQRPVGGDRLALYVHPGHPLLDKPPTIAALANALWILREAGSGTRSGFEHAIRANGLDPSSLKTVLELPSNEAILAAVEAGEFVTAVSELAAAPLVAAGRIEKLQFELNDRCFWLVAHHERVASRAAAAFVAEL